MNKEWWQSKTKWGAIFIAGGTVLGTIGAALTGTIDWGTAVNTIIGIGAGLGIWGFRDTIKK